MDNETLELLTKEINSNLEALSKIEKGGNEYGIVVEDTCRLLDKASDIVKHNDELEMKKKDQQDREESKKVEQDSQKKESKWNHVIDGAKIIVPVVTAAALVLHDDRISKMLLKFEETGTLTNSYGRSFFGKILKRGK